MSEESYQLRGTIKDWKIRGIIAIGLSFLMFLALPELIIIFILAFPLTIYWWISDHSGKDTSINVYARESCAMAIMAEISWIVILILIIRWIISVV